MLHVDERDSLNCGGFEGKNAQAFMQADMGLGVFVTQCGRNRVACHQA